MQRYSKSKTQGFTLIELLLVLVIISIIIYASVGYMQQRAVQLRVDRTSAQMQQIMNAAMSFYIGHGRWPTGLTEIQDEGYLPSAVGLENPWGQVYNGVPYAVDATKPANFYVWTSVPGRFGPAQAISSSLPFGYTTANADSPPIGTPCGTGTTSCNVVGFVNVPGQNLNNATAVTFAGLYKHGGCVPVPQCPVDSTGKTLIPQIMVVPVSVSGLVDDNTRNVYPISSFTAYAVGSLDANGVPTNTTPPRCTNSTSLQPDNTNCLNTPNQGAFASAYWRVCLDIVTEKGNVNRPNRVSGNQSWGQYVTMMAITRCSIPSAPAGSTFKVFGN